MAALPIRADLLDRAFGVFCKTGELPDGQRLAAAVVARALGRSPPPSRDDPEKFAAHLRRLIAVAKAEIDHGVPPPQISIREHVFDEAVYGPDVIRRGARALLKLEVELGADVTDPSFLADRTLPDHAGIGLHLLGFPEFVATPPYEAQAHRLFARLAELRDRIDQDDTAPWFLVADDAVVAFRRGELPQDELLLDTVLVNAEFQALWWHSQGYDNAELLAACDAAAQSIGADRDAAVERVRVLVQQEYATQLEAEHTR
ncbi:MAG TPA: hypothetical protein VFZ65_01490 [Planctomycetota bacterium]|nr:hypothetical protein [Planctomycetota bacterium]